MGRMISSLILFFLLIGAYEGQPTDKKCCKTKTVGGVPYVFVSEGKVPAACKSGCIYARDDSNSSRVCFAAGELPVTCGDTETLNTCSRDKNTKDSPKRIFGGKNETNPKWQVALIQKDVIPRDGSDIFCGGSLITSQTVVTAAHCMFDKQGKQIFFARNFMAWIGLLDVQDTQNVLKINVINITINMLYNPTGSGDNDIAVLTIAKVDGIEKYKPICLPPNNNNLYDGVCAETTGWGAVDGTDPNYVFPKVLQGLEEKIISNQECAVLYQGQLTIFHTNICFSYEFDKGTCVGDSGGPLVYTHTESIKKVTHYLIGVTSRGPRPCTRQQPSIFMRVTKYLDFIRQELTDPESQSLCI